MDPEGDVFRDLFERVSGLVPIDMTVSLQDVADADEIAAVTNADMCLQCHKCSSGCPSASGRDLKPSDVVRLLQLRDKESLLSSEAIWACSTCHTCSTRCPAGVDTAAIHDRLRALCLAEGRVPADPRTAASLEAFAASMARCGRVNELEVIRRYKQRTGAYLEDFGVGLALLLRGKIRIRTSRIRDASEVAGLIERAQRHQDEEG